MGYKIVKQQQQYKNELDEIFSKIPEAEETTVFKEKIIQYVNSRKDLNENENKLLTMVLLTYFTTQTILSMQEIMKSFNIALDNLPIVRQQIISMMIKQYVSIFVNSDNHIYFGILPSKKIVNEIIGYSEETESTNPLDIIVEMSIAVFTGIITHTEFQYYLDNVVDKLSEKHPEIFNLFMAQETTIEQLMLSLALRSALYEDGLVAINDFAFDIFKNADESSEVINKILSKEYKSFAEHIFYIEEDEEGHKCFKLSGKYIVAAFGEGFSIKNAHKQEGLKEDEDIGEQDLFFNPKLQEKVNMLHDAVSEAKYQNIITKLKDANMSTGITALFAGEPGTGKTALAKELAYRSGRALFFVDSATIRGKYVGESEKNTQKIFEDYRRAQRRLTKTPILLFNEADAILGSRIEDVSSSTDQMTNTMQNILLEEFERFDGILIATTNLAGNLDKAFDRRFLFKIEFELPDEEQRMKIWKSRLPHFDDSVLKELAKTKIAGGEITKIIKQYIIASEVGLLKSYEDIFKLIEKPVITEPVMGFKISK